MSWMTKEGSSSALGQLLPRFQPSEPSPREVAPGRHDAGAADRDCIVGDRGASAAATGRAATRSVGKALGEPLGQGGVYGFEGFG
jgi:hypothetical protein